MSPKSETTRGLRGLGRSATLAIATQCESLRDQGRDVFELGLGQSPFPVPGKVVEALRRHAEESDYLPVEGLPALRQAVAGHLRRRLDASYEPSDILVGPGSKELMFQLFLAFEGEILLPVPAWVSYEPQARILGRGVRRLRTRGIDGWRLRPEHLDACCRMAPDRPRLLVLNYPANPTGTSYDADHLARLAEVAREHRLVILADEIYGRLHHDAAHASIARFYPEGTIYSGGLSKWCGAGGWRLGVFAMPPPLHGLRDALVVLGSETFSSACAPVQHAAVDAFADDAEIDGYVDRSRRVVAALGAHLTDTLREAGASVAGPEGGFYAFPDFTPAAERLARRGIRTDRQLCARLLDDTGVAILPGSCFGREPEELTARIAYVDFDGGAAIDALRHANGQGLDDRFLRRWCGRTVAAVERIADWLGPS